MTGACRSYLLRTSGGRLVQHGWWSVEGTAGQVRGWGGEYGSISGARVALTDEDTAGVLATWPDPS
ncbi:hypothetical protein [Streptomyces collinus]|uniref:hypothetical protein n=1 Tax=Streptomyces collinus TaxID=42684 RepID=UPI001063A75F